MNGRDVTLFDRFARQYDIAMPTARSSDLQVGLDYATRPIARVVDVGGGTGRGVNALTATGVVDASLVVDPARGMLNEITGATTPIQGSATALPLADASTDAVLVVDALHHMPAHEQVLAEAARILRPGGVLVVREFDPSTLRGRALVLAERLVGFDSTFHTPDGLAARMRRAGLRVAIPKRGFDYTVVGVVPWE